jgi:hypothetical protein
MISIFSSDIMSKIRANSNKSICNGNLSVDYSRQSQDENAAFAAKLQDT